MGTRTLRHAGTALLLAFAVASPLGAAPANGHAALGATLDGLLAHARERHPELRAMRHEADAAAERIVPAGSLPDPMFQAELRDVTNEMAGGSPNLLPARVGSTRYQFRQTFPAWGSRDAKRDAARAASDEAALRAEATWTELAMRIKTGYAAWQRLHAQIDQQRELLALVDRMESAAQVRYAGGLAPQQDAIRAQLERTAMASDLAMLEAEVDGTRARLNSLLTRPVEAPLATPLPADALPSLARLDIGALRERVLARNPALAAEDARIRAAEKTQDAVWSNRYPEFTIGVAPVQTRNRISEWELMFEVTIPLQQTRRRAEEREAQAMVSAAQARKEAAANEALSALGEALSALESARRVATLTQTSLLPQAQISLQSALAGYESGKVDFATVLEAQRQIRQARLTLIRTQAEARTRLAEIERLIGGEL